MSHTIEPKGFTPAILVFSAQPRVSIYNYNQIPQTVTNLIDLMTMARREHEAIVSQLRLRIAMTSAPPNEAVLYISSGN